MTATEGGVTLPVLDCIFHSHESIESFPRKFDDVRYRSLPYLYVVCLADTSTALRHIVAGVVVKTDLTHKDPEFADSVTAAIEASSNLKRFLGPQIQLLPARLSVEGNEPLSERELLQILATQYVKFAVGGNA
jgi:hypothetical protein